MLCLSCAGWATLGKPECGPEYPAWKEWQTTKDCHESTTGMWRKIRYYREIHGPPPAIDERRRPELLVFNSFRSERHLVNVFNVQNGERTVNVCARCHRRARSPVRKPMHVVCDWLGNTREVAAKHYLQVTDEHFRKATQTAHDRGDSEGLRIPRNCQMSHVDKAGPLLPSLQVAEAGLERGGESRGKTATLERGGAESGAVDALVDADLRSIVDAWSQLTRSTKAEILDMVRTGIARRPRI